MATEVERLPILFVDLSSVGPRRIYEMLRDLKFECTAQQAQDIYDFYKPLPDDGDELFSRIVDCVRVDYQKPGALPLKEVLSGLAKEWKASRADERVIIERRMMVATNGLGEHPDWDYACLCDDCRSCT